MDYNLLTDKAIAEEMGRRLKKLRLQHNFSQVKISEFTGLSDKTIAYAEQGKSTLITYVQILRALGALNSLDGFLPDVGISPLELAKSKGRERQRASGKKD